VSQAASEFFSGQSTGSQSTKEFDRLFASGDYRAIASKQVQFAAAFATDNARQQKLRTALEKVQNAEAAAEKAKIYASNGDSAGAWEQIELATSDWADDLNLNKLRSDYSEKAAPFVSAVKAGEDAEASKDYGYSLSNFLYAQQLYPSSEIANAAIKRISGKILDALTPGQETHSPSPEDKKPSQLDGKSPDTAPRSS
ncbi:MAG TPA: hypothetical protein VIM48_10025, partial [Chthoniobacterales bacterium]